MQKYKNALTHQKEKMLIISLYALKTTKHLLLLAQCYKYCMLKLWPCKGVCGVLDPTPHASKRPTQNIFVSWAGKPLAPSSVSHLIHSQWIKAGLFDENWARNLSCNIIRKSLTTANHEEDVGNP